jgi:hypothetical protein
LKNQYAVELIRGRAVLWTVWLKQNRLCFNDGSTPRNITVIGMQIISLARYWCEKKGKTTLLHLSIVLSQDVEALPMRVQDLAVGLSEEEGVEKISARKHEVTRVVMTVSLSRREINEL